MRYGGTSNAVDLAALCDEASLLHFRMIAVIERLRPGEHGPSGRRAVLRNLEANGPMTVPELAALRPVSRQAMQVTVGSLCDDGLIAAQPNPTHRRSSFWALTESGLAWLGEARAVEAPLFAAASARFEPEEVARAVEVLRALRGHADELLAQLRDER